MCVNFQIVKTARFSFAGTGNTNYNFKRWIKAAGNYSANHIKNYTGNVRKVAASASYLYGGVSNPWGDIFRKMQENAKFIKTEPTPEELKIPE